MCLTVSQTHTHTLRRCPSARAGNSSDDPPVCFRNNLPLRLRHGAVALIQMNHFTNLFPPLTRRQSFLSFPPVLSPVFAGPSPRIFLLCSPLLFLAYVMRWMGSFMIFMWVSDHVLLHLMEELCYFCKPKF